VPSVLIVDDSAVARRLAGGLLEKHDWTVDYAAGGKEALAQMAACLPDLVVTDLHMPEMNGLELVAAIKKDFPPVPVILMTAIGSEEVAAQALREGAASYVPKRRLADDLLSTVQRIFRGALEDRAQPLLMHYMETCALAFVLPNDLALIHATVNHLQPMLRCLPLADETERLRVGIALEEALSNAYYHGNLEVGATLGQADRQACAQLAAERLWQPPYCDRQIRLSANISRKEAVFVVGDDGPGFDVSKLPATFPADGEQGTGRGVILMRSIMDEVTFNEAGNQVTLVKRRVVEATDNHAE
jgi:CheY-like chemotaxis protein/anti-sigma regulatory factor (Ser/Thr protein kinase)